MKMFRIVLKVRDGVNRGDILVNTYEKSKSGKVYNVEIGACTCSKNTCDCIIPMMIPVDIVDRIYETEVAVRD